MTKRYHVGASHNGQFYAYNRDRLSCVIETERTPDRETAQAWADALSRGEGLPGVKVNSYADD